MVLVMECDSFVQYYYYYYSLGIVWECNSHVQIIHRLGKMADAGRVLAVYVVQRILLSHST